MAAVTATADLPSARLARPSAATSDPSPWPAGACTPPFPAPPAPMEAMALQLHFLVAGHLVCKAVSAGANGLSGVEFEGVCAALGGACVTSDREPFQLPMQPGREGPTYGPGTAPALSHGGPAALPGGCPPPRRPLPLPGGPYCSYFLVSMPSGGLHSTLPVPTSVQLVLSTVPLDSWKDLFMALRVSSSAFA